MVSVENQVDEKIWQKIFDSTFTALSNIYLIEIMKYSFPVLF